MNNFAFEIKHTRAKLESAIKSAESVDAVSKAHEAFLDSCLTETLLTDRAVTKTIGAVLSVCAVYVWQYKFFYPVLFFFFFLLFYFHVCFNFSHCSMCLVFLLCLPVM